MLGGRKLYQQQAALSLLQEIGGFAKNAKAISSGIDETQSHKLNQPTNKR
jgi:hypothetical protein